MFKTDSFFTQRWFQLPIFRRDLLETPIIRNGSKYGFVPYQNLSNHYDPATQSKTIGPTVPFRLQLPTNTLQHSMGPNSRLPDELVRQLVAHQQATNQMLTFYKSVRT